MAFSVKVLVGNSAGQVINIPGPKFYIGRSEDCQLRPRSDLISRHHCAFIVEGEYFGIRDFGSKNGTYVNGQRVIGECELKDGDKLKVGPLEFEAVITVDDPLAGKKKSKVTSVKEAANRTAESTSTPVDANELDIDEWLAAGDEGETREMRTSEQTTELTINPQLLQGDQETQAVQNTSDTVADLKKMQPSKLPQGPKSGSSDEAAAEMLRRLRRR